MIDFEEFLVMNDRLGWTQSPSEEDLKQYRISYYGQASIVRWLADDTRNGKKCDSIDVTVSEPKT